MKNIGETKEAGQAGLRNRPPSPTRSGLLRRTFLIAFVLVSGGLITGGVIELYYRYLETMDTIAMLQGEMARSAAFKIRQFVRDIEKTLRATPQSRENVRGGLSDAYRFQLLKMMKITPAITTVVVIGEDGKEMFKESRIHKFDPRELKDRSKEEGFLASRSGVTHYGPVYFVRQSEPYMNITVPIEWFAGQFEGVLLAEVNLKFIWEVISAIKVGEKGYAYAVSAKGDLVAHPDISLVLQKQNLNHLSQVREALGGQPGNILAVPNLAGQQVFPAYAAIPDLGWAVLVERPVEEAYAPLFGSILRTFLLLLVGLCMALLASLLIGRRVLRPVRILRQGAALIGAGDLNHRIDIRTGDELEVLAEEFNEMAAQLRAERAGLEQKVEERTEELADTLNQQTAISQIFRVISTSTTDLEPAFDIILKNACKIMMADTGMLTLFDGQNFHKIYHHGASPAFTQWAQEMLPLSPHPDSAMGMIAVERKPIHTLNLKDTAAYRAGAPERTNLVDIEGARTSLHIPLLKETRLIGAFIFYRREVRKFTEKQIELAQTFSDQAVIAIENARLLEAIQARTEEVEVASRHKSEFLANMSHELRTPLNAILGYTELIQDNIYGELPDKAMEVMGRVQVSGKHLLTLINEVLDLSKIEAGQLTLTLGKYSMKAVVQNVFTAMESLAAAKGLKFNVHFPEDLPIGIGDEQRLTQVLLNLTVNAIKFTDQGSVNIKARSDNGNFHVSITDSGEGIPPESQAYIFDEFRQVDSSSTKKKGGTGLGLAIAKKFVELHNGHIGVESQPRKGSIFWFEVPIQVENSEKTR